ncbi:type IV pilus modification protein PilV [Acinetobacter johnsonii]|nr:type IV pilus modification protein PilV [Acinetobacter johnsonii]
MNYKKNQIGVGLVEVLVALVLLALGVLGYTALQLRAVDATGEALNRSQATLILRGLTESIRANPDGQGSYPAAVQGYLGLGKKTAAPKCLNSACIPAEMAKYDAYMAADAAQTMGMVITMAECPGVKSVKRQCLFAAWDDTAPKLKATDYSKCMDSKGIYVPSARCLMMEAY